MKIGCTTTMYESITTAEKRKMAGKYYGDYKGKIFKNIDKGIAIEFIGDGMRKISFGGRMYSKKLALLKCLPKIILNMRYNNFGKAKSTDKSTVLGYLNFKISVMIDEKKENLRIAIQLRSNGKFYYNHDVNKV